MTKPHFRYPRDALGLTRIAIEGMPADTPARVKDAVDFIGQAIGDRDRALEDWLQQLDNSSFDFFDAIIDPTNGATNPAAGDFSGAHDDPENHIYLTVGSALTNEAVWRPLQPWLTFGVRNTNAPITEASATTLGSGISLHGLSLFAIGRQSNDGVGGADWSVSTRQVWDLKGSQIAFTIASLYVNGLHIKNTGASTAGIIEGAAHELFLEDCIYDCSNYGVGVTLTSFGSSGNLVAERTTFVDPQFTCLEALLADCHVVSIAITPTVNCDMYWDGGSYCAVSVISG